MRYFTIILLISILLNGCLPQKQKDLAFKIFNEGVALSLDAANEYQKGNFAKSEVLNNKAIDKFIETLKIDSTHALAPSALGHCYYLIKDFKNGIIWYEKAISIDSMVAANHREYGLCKINIGDIDGGRFEIDKAFKLDTSKKMKKMTIVDLTDIGSVAFDYGIGVEKQGEKDKGLEYKQFSLGVLITAYNYDSTNLDIIKKIADFSESLGDKNTSERFYRKIKKTSCNKGYTRCRLKGLRN